MARIGRLDDNTGPRAGDSNSSTSPGLWARTSGTLGKLKWKQTWLAPIPLHCVCICAHECVLVGKNGESHSVQQAPNFKMSAECSGNPDCGQTQGRTSQ